MTVTKQVRVWPSEDREERLHGLMVEAQGGCRASYRNLLDEILPLARSYVKRRLADSCNGDDCVQDTLISLHRARHTFDPANKFSPWLFAVLRHKVIDHVRSRKVTLKYFSEEVLEDYLQVEMPQPSIEQRLDLEKILRGLNADDQAIIRAVKLEGQSIFDMSRRLNVSPGSLKVRVHRILNSLVDKYASE